MNLKNLRQHELIKLIESYDRYIQDANDEDLYLDKWRPACISEYYGCDFQEEQEREYITLGSKLMVTDPCYEVGTWCQTELDIKPGRYECFLETSDEGKWGIRNARITIVHEEYDPIEYYPEQPEKGTVAVDSGQAGFFDLEYFKEHRSEGGIKNGSKAEIFYDKCCEITSHSDDQSGMFDNKCFVSSSGYGDGCYDLYSARNKEGQIVALELEFINDRDCEDEE